MVLGSALQGRRELGAGGGLWLGLLPVLLATPIALPFFKPPAEHGLFTPGLRCSRR